MLKLSPYEVCPYGSFCKYSQDAYGKCDGLNSKRTKYFICELWAENYIKKEFLK